LYKGAIDSFYSSARLLSHVRLGSCVTSAVRGRQSGSGLKPPHAAVVKSDGSERCGNAGTRFRQARLRQASVSEPPQDENDGCDARREKRVRDEPGSPEPERAGHDQHRAWEGRQHEAGPCEVVQSRCERAISGADDRVRCRSCAIIVTGVACTLVDALMRQTPLVWYRC